MGGFPSGQREQTVNLSSMTSVVRIHHLPPESKPTFSFEKVGFFQLLVGFAENGAGKKWEISVIFLSFLSGSARRLWDDRIG